MPALVKALWPIAAALMLGVGIYGAASFESGNAAASESQQAELVAERERVEQMRIKLDETNRQTRYVNAIIAAVNKPSYHELIGAIGRSCPEGVWLESLRVDDSGKVSIQGPSRTDDLVFAFVEQLKKLPMLADISLQGQQPVQLEQGPAIRFDIKCRYVENNGSKERTAHND